MPSGGARTVSGPPPDKNATRRGRTANSGLIQLPASGREGEAPPWPLGRSTSFERATWAREWIRPQAIMWERLGWEPLVALYVRTLRTAMSGKGAAQTTRNVMSQMDMLGLSDAGMKRLGWQIVDRVQPSAPPRPATSTAKDRLTVLRGGADVRAS